jgi:hypothetical protein
VHVALHVGCQQMYMKVLRVELEVCGCIKQICFLWRMLEQQETNEIVSTYKTVGLLFCESIDIHRAHCSSINILANRI